MGGPLAVRYQVEQNVQESSLGYALTWLWYHVRSEF